MIKILEYIWIVLVTLTIFAYLLGYLKIITTALVAVLLFTTFIKGALVSDYFMGLKDVGIKYRLIPIIWLTVIMVLIAVAYYLPVNNIQ
ncbi:MAG: cytochrome C oxidase subunit IV family protein [Epsilonproteobacteria bacterium]|nr:cytochrome C oxidase subunit IV family protein [Campylobacterota bacterium]